MKRNISSHSNNKITLEASCVSYLLAVIKHSEEEHGHQEQRRLFGPQEVSVGAAAEKKLLQEFTHMMSSGCYTEANWRLLSNNKSKSHYIFFVFGL